MADDTASWISGLERRASSAATVLYDDEGRVLVVKANYKKYWSFPGGIIDAGETPPVAAIRETREETGLTVDPSQLEFCMVVSRQSSLAQTYQFVFEQRVDGPLLESVSIASNNEIEDWALVTREDIIRGDRLYSKTTTKWAEGFKGYTEYDFTPSDRIDR